MKRIASLVYGLLCYLAFLAAILYAIGFTGNMAVPTGIDGKPATSPVTAVIANAALVCLFALQHSVMARTSFKRWWMRFVPTHLERSSYVLMASACLFLLMWFWQPLDGIIWQVNDRAAKDLLFLLFFTGWFIVFFATFLINHFDLFGLRQVWLYFRGSSYRPLPFRTPALYKMVRHPLYLGFLIAFWATPIMTVGHLVFSFLFTVYVLLAIQLEENDLRRLFGSAYRLYQKQVPMLIPFLRRKSIGAKPCGLKRQSR